MNVSEDAGRRIARFPRTRYQGSKRKLAATIVGHLAHLEFDTVLDAFGGTGAVAHALKRAGKSVTYNDVLQFNHRIGVALIENDSVGLSAEEIESVARPWSEVARGDFIERTFAGIYFTGEENRWLDAAVARISRLECRFKRALAWFALFQSAMAKRPYNLFHRNNLYMRSAKVARSFGNKTTWDRPFPEHFAAFAAEANEAVVDSGGRCRALCGDALTVEPGYDLVYVDTPYINRAGVGVDYRDFYHFLEGLVRYDEWAGMIDYRSRHRRLTPLRNPWGDARVSPDMFRRLFEWFSDSIVAVSYRSDGIPSIDELAGMLRRVKPCVRVIEGNRSQYALSTRRDTRHVLLIGTA